jgi:hypothetical protein
VPTGFLTMREMRLFFVQTQLSAHRASLKKHSDEASRRRFLWSEAKRAVSLGCAEKPNGMHRSPVPDRPGSSRDWEKGSESPADSKKARCIDSKGGGRRCHEYFRARGFLARRKVPYRTNHCLPGGNRLLKRRRHGFFECQGYHGDRLVLLSRAGMNGCKGVYLHQQQGIRRSSNRLNERWGEVSISRGKRAFAPNI